MNKLTWDQVEVTANKLADEVEESKFKPDYLVGVTTGGLFPLALLARRLKRTEILTITACEYWPDHYVLIERVTG